MEVFCLGEGRPGKERANEGENGQVICLHKVSEFGVVCWRELVAYVLLGICFLRGVPEDVVEERVERGLMII